MNRMQQLACIVLSAGLVLPLAGSSAAPMVSNSLAGTWEIVVQPDPIFEMPPVVNFSTATKDGSIINVDPAGNGVGEWKRLSGSNFAVSFWGFLTLQGQAVQFKVRGELSTGSGADNLTGPFVTDVSDLSGAPLFSFSGMVTANRLEIEAL